MAKFRTNDLTSLPGKFAPAWMVLVPLLAVLTAMILGAW